MIVKESEISYLDRNKNYKKYEKQKDKLKAKYPPTLFAKPGYSNRYKGKATDDERELYKEYIGKLMDIINKPNSHYQNYLWDTLSSSEKLFREAKVNGSSRVK
jgi:hypothetical protein|tara:strand:- start:456 stop:764 length:309 start_codon:yes stop_codon:yes gene_type:complete